MRTHSHTNQQDEPVSLPSRTAVIGARELPQHQQHGPSTSASVDVAWRPAFERNQDMAPNSADPSAMTMVGGGQFGSISSAPFGFSATTNHEPLWLLGDDFDLSTLDSSITTAASLWDHAQLQALPDVGPSSLLNDLDATSSLNDNAYYQRSTESKVHERWYTQPKIDTFYRQSTSAGQNVRDRVDESYRVGLSHTLRPFAHDGMLPSADFLVSVQLWARALSKGKRDSPSLFALPAFFSPILCWSSCADFCAESVHQTLLRQVSFHLPHRPRALISPFVRECASPFVHLFAGGPLCRI